MLVQWSIYFYSLFVLGRPTLICFHPGLRPRPADCRWLVGRSSPLCHVCGCHSFGGGSCGRALGHVQPSRRGRCCSSWLPWGLGSRGQHACGRIGSPRSCRCCQRCLLQVHAPTPGHHSWTGICSGLSQTPGKFLIFFIANYCYTNHQS